MVNHSPLQESNDPERSAAARSRRAIRYNLIMPWFVYIARARTGRYYVGITTNPGVVNHWLIQAKNTTEKTPASAPRFS